jgi:hypothetical protein
MKSKVMASAVGLIAAFLLAAPRKIRCLRNCPSSMKESPSRSISKHGVFSGELKQDITDGTRAASSLNAKGKSGFDKLSLEVTFKAGQADSGVLVGEGHIVEQ